MKKADPINFAYVMGTGGISILFSLTGWNTLSLIFFYLCVLSYVGLVAISCMRLIFFKRRFLKETFNVLEMFDYLMFASASNTLAIRFSLSGYEGIGFVLMCIGSIAAVVFIYLIFGLLFFQEKIPLQWVSPFWLLIAISLNSIGLSITTLWQDGSLTNPSFLTAAFCFWSCGVLSYLLLMSLNLYRFFFLPFDGKDISSAYWTCMGAAAIAALDGGRLALIANPPLFLEMVQPFIEGTVFLLWAWATAWIPILCMMEFFKYGYYKTGFRYHPALWSMIFPLSMYTLATHHFATKYSFAFLASTVPFWMWATLVCWFAILASIGISFNRLMRS